MMIHPRIWISILLLFAINICAQDTVKIISYNVENLFDCQHDSLKNDSAFLPEGLYHWTNSRYHTKLNRIAQVIVNISGWQNAPIIGLCEVENKKCLTDLCSRLRRYPYKILHYESPDERGIDVALLMDSTRIQLIHSYPIRIHLDGDHTRDILYAHMLVDKKDSLHLMMCHLPSQSGGASNSEWKRRAAKQIIQSKVDSIMAMLPNDYIVVMGDMNTKPRNDLSHLSNLMIEFEQQAMGTHKYQGVWTCLDQFYVSNNLLNQTTAQIFNPIWLLEKDEKYLNTKPYRTYIGYRYHKGYSDHLPIVLNWIPKQ